MHQREGQKVECARAGTCGKENLDSGLRFINTYSGSIESNIRDITTVKF
jgi:hypothetical protein